MTDSGLRVLYRKSVFAFRQFLLLRVLPCAHADQLARRPYEPAVAAHSLARLVERLPRVVDVVAHVGFEDNALFLRVCRLQQGRKKAQHEENGFFHGSLFWVENKDNERNEPDKASGFILCGREFYVRVYGTM